MKDYAITILEYGVQIGFSNAMVFSGYYGDGERTNVTYTFNVLQNEDGVILVDTGYDNRSAEDQALADGVNLTNYHSPAEMLKKIGICAEDVKHVILTHAHWDHMGGISLFPNATFYLQADELTKRPNIPPADSPRQSYTQHIRPSARPRDTSCRAPSMTSRRDIALRAHRRRRQACLPPYRSYRQIQAARLAPPPTCPHAHSCPARRAAAFRTRRFPSGFAPKTCPTPDRPRRA